MYFLLKCAFLFGGDIFSLDGISNCVKFDPAVLSFFKKSWVVELRIGWHVDYAKGVKIFVLFHWRYKKPTKIRKPEELSLTRRRALERKEPLRRGMSYVWPALSRHFRRNYFSCLSWCWIFLRLLDLQLHEFLHVEPQRAHRHWPSEPPPDSLGVGRCGRSRENC